MKITDEDLIVLHFNKEDTMVHIHRVQEKSGYI